MKVKLLRYTADAELLCGAVALTSTKGGGPSEIFEGMDSEAERAPALFENVGPSYIELGYCLEGKMKPPERNVEETKKRFRSLQFFIGVSGKGNAM